MIINVNTFVLRPRIFNYATETCKHALCNLWKYAKTGSTAFLLFFFFFFCSNNDRHCLRLQLNIKHTYDCKCTIFIATNVHFNFYVSPIALFWLDMSKNITKTFFKKSNFPCHIQGRNILQIPIPTNHKKAYVSLH